MKWLVLSTLVSLVAAAARTSPPAGCKVVSKDGKGQFSTVQAAVDSLSVVTPGKQCIFIYPGVYSEQVLIIGRSAQLTVYGYTEDSSHYKANNVTIAQKLSQGEVPSNDLTATLRAHNVGLRVYNINLRNDHGPGFQALAVSALSDQQAFYGVGFIGYQDTVLADAGKQLYARCYIDGATDFIFGRRARAWFDNVDLRLKGPGYITANGRNETSNVGYFVINKSSIAAASGVNVAAGSVYLGRPWRNFSRVVFQNTAMSDVINSAGWTLWTDQEPNTDKVFYGEYNNTGPGASGARAKFSRALGEPIAISSILGVGYTSWVDTSYL